MHLLLTRPLEDSQRTAAALAAAGHSVEIEPLLTVRLTPRPLDLAGVQALLVTSVNGLRAFVAASPRRDLPVLAVGPASAEEARAAGFGQVVSAEGDAAALAELAIAQLDPAAGALLHPAGSVSAGGLAERLEPAGFALRRVVLYEAATAEALSERTAAALRARAFDGVLLYSPRTATHFVRLVREGGLTGSCEALAAYCLSANVAAALAPLPLRRVRVATKPQESALLREIEQDGGDGGGASARRSTT